MNVNPYRAAAILCLLVANIARAATLVVTPSADTTLFEQSPDANLGAAELGAGGIRTPVDEAPDRMRALMRFDLSAIPANATVTTVELAVTIVRVPPAPGTGSQFQLHRLLKPWGEGNKAGTIGSSAAAGEATWLGPQHGGETWVGEGASGDADAVPAVSSSVAMDGLGTYTFRVPATSTRFISDVQGWVARPTLNFGWLMRSADEETHQTARRFASRQSATGKPTLTVTYEVPVADLSITQFELRPAGMFFAWTGGAPPFRVERAESILGPWTAVTAPSTETQAIAPAEPAIAFYRVVSVTP